MSATVIHMKCVALCGLGVRVLGQCQDIAAGGVSAVVYVK